METLASIGQFIKERREAAEVSIRELARAAGVSNPYISQIERGLRKPSAEVLSQLARALEVSAETLYVQAGYLSDSKAPNHTTEAIAKDTELEEHQKSQLLDLYAQFVIANQEKEAQL